MSDKLKRTTVFLTEDQHESLRRLAYEQRTSMASLIRDAVLDLIEDREDVAPGLKALADEKGTITWKQYQKHKRKASRNNGV